jgi:glycosyltransferase involved in cell wall biosynthesis
MQGGALELARRVDALAREVGPPDVVLVTDMVNLPTLIALARPWLNDVPIHLYAHENQLTYPPPPGEKRDLTYGMINTLSMVAADAVHFNSAYHREEFFDELPRLLKHFPDYNHLEIISQLREKSDVLPVGLNLSYFDAFRPKIRQPGPLRILWNQRWEYDKNPGDFFRALIALADEGLDFQLIVAGENFRQQPAEFAQARKRLAGRILHFGFAESRADYARLLWHSDLVLSTAIHEFFGISVLEAVYCGAWPLLPTRLSYPELLPEPLHADHLYRNFDDLLAKLRWAVTHPAAVRAGNLSGIADRFSWEKMAGRYDQEMAEIGPRMAADEKDDNLRGQR